MATLRNGQWLAPFWVAEKAFIPGEDMLGMQNTSIATYAVLVPGLTAEVDGKPITIGLNAYIKS